MTNEETRWYLLHAQGVEGQLVRGLERRKKVTGSNPGDHHGTISVPGTVPADPGCHFSHQEHMFQHCSNPVTMFQPIKVTRLWLNQNFSGCWQWLLLISAQHFSKSPQACGRSQHMKWCTREMVTPIYPLCFIYMNLPFDCFIYMNLPFDPNDIIDD